MIDRYPENQQNPEDYVLLSEDVPLETVRTMHGLEKDFKLTPTTVASRAIQTYDFVESTLMGGQIIWMTRPSTNRQKTARHVVQLCEVDFDTENTQLISTYVVKKCMDILKLGSIVEGIAESVVFAKGVSYYNDIARHEATGGTLFVSKLE